MFHLKTSLLLAAGIFIAQSLNAQYHYNFWFRGTLATPISAKFKADAEFQHRRQNGYQNKNMFDKNLMFTFRTWVHYRYSEDVKFSVSPFAYFSHYKIIQRETDETVAPGSEIRFSGAVELQHELFKRFYIIDRNALEYRVFNSQSNVTRLRARLGVRYDFTEKIKLTVFDELFFNVAGTQVHNMFDHDRVGVNLEYVVLPNLKFDIAYLHLTRLSAIPVADIGKLKENNIIINLTYSLQKKNKSTE